MSKPLVVYSKPDLPHTSALMRHSDLLDFAELNSVPIGDWPVVYMRCAHYTWTDELELAGKIEERFRSNNIRIVNSIENRIRCQRKDYYYPILQNAGVPVPTFVHHPTINEIRYMSAHGLSWPFIHRSTDGSRGRDMYLVHNEQEFHEADAALIAKGRRRISVQFIDAKGPGKYYTRRRAFVVFGKIDMWLSDISDTWNTQSDSVKEVELKDFNYENKKFSPSAQACIDAVKVGDVLGLEIYAVDMVSDPITGIYYVVDVNPTYRASPIPMTLHPKLQALANGHFMRVANALCSAKI